ncbi:putative major facilitator superfamily transporter protein [Neofusicoccum parvum UCRNP2]|uniref:Putative major facilitator superfamily transporter protein n=1 Tax=Botryosphaeria parva (strain UCR-NP2) TaxID=1287680 RepID=R1GBY4_BOTPV|nr:putative major facilitator superfamily transporter protein [Neofusicoccum parvum UCRNP2]
MVRKFTIHLLIVFVSGFIWYAMAALLPQATLYMYTNDPIEIGLIAIPNGFGTAVGGWVIPSLIQYIKHVRGQIVLAVLIQTVVRKPLPSISQGLQPADDRVPECQFTACYAAVIPHNKAAWIVIQFFGQGCFAWLTTLAYLAAGLFVRHDELGTASGLIGTFRSAGGSIGNAIFSTVLHSVINRELQDSIADAAVRAGFDAQGLPQLIPAVISDAVGVPGAFAGVQVNDVVRSAARDAFRDTYAKAYRMVFYTSIPLGVVALVAAWFVEDPSPLLTDHVAVVQERDVLAGKRISIHRPAAEKSDERQEPAVEHRENVNGEA